MRQRWIAAILTALTVLTTTACGSLVLMIESSSPLPPAETPEPAETEAVGALSTPEPPFISADDAYNMAASYAVVNPQAHSTDLGPGQHWVVAVVTLANDSGPTVSVTAEDLALVDANGNRYAPEPGSTLSPELVGYTLAEGENIYGFAAFALPVSAEPRFVAWCPGGTCDQELQSPIRLQ
ncbi:MAG: hypothetical protein ACOCX3_04025 [Chloroflexota bacterium]